MAEPDSLNPNTENPDPLHPETQPDDGVIPPDPLLGSDTFIDADDDGTTPNGGAEPTMPQPIQAVPIGSGVEWAAEPSGPASSPVTETPTSQRKPKRQLEDMAERPSWLPENWRMELRVRTSGATAGSVDRYYFDPVSGHKFRSKNEVLHYIETGSKRRKKAASSDTDATPSEGSGVQKPKKSKTKVGDFSGVNFDFVNPPQNMSWVLTSASQDKWTPSNGEGMISESVKRDWDKAFSCVSQLEHRRKAAKEVKEV